MIKYTVTEPVAQFALVTMSVRPSTVQVGDVIIGKIHSARVEEIVTIGRKWVTLRVLPTEGQKPVTREFLIEEEIQISRRQETQESRQARRLAVQERGIVDYANGWTPSTPDILAKIQEDVAQGYVISSSRVDGLINAQASDQVEGAWVQALKYLLEQGKTPTEAREVYKESLVKDVIQAQRGTSRSTSVVSNAMEDAVAKAKADFITSWWMY